MNNTNELTMRIKERAGQSLSGRFLTAEARINNRGSQSWNGDERRGTGRGSSRISSVFQGKYHSTAVPYTFMHHVMSLPWDRQRPHFIQKKPPSFAPIKMITVSHSEFKSICLT
jgi:hypothetical protein